MLFITELDQPAVNMGHTLAHQFSLTPTEAQVASMLIEGMTKQQMCMQLKVTTSTMAFHLRNLFSKTQTNRQAELVGVLLSRAYTQATSTVPVRA